MNEFYKEVTFYGMAAIIRQYACFPRCLPLPVSIQHGWTLATSPAHALAEAPENWYWSVMIEQEFRRHYPEIGTRTVGAPFLYLLKLLNYAPIPLAEQQGSIVFPSHSAPRIKMTCDFEEYAAQLMALPTQFKPITVCLYYLDRERGLDEPFLRKGFQVVSNGASRYDGDFLRNFVRNTHGKRFAFSNQMTSALLFAVAMGLTAYFWGPAFSADNPNLYWQGRDYNHYLRLWEDRYRDIFRFPDSDQLSQQAIVEEELGRNQMLTPEQMRNLLWRLTRQPKYLRQFIKQGRNYLRRIARGKVLRER